MPFGKFYLFTYSKLDRNQFLVMGVAKGGGGGSQGGPGVLVTPLPPL